MNKQTQRHLRSSAFLATGAAGAIALAYQVADVKAATQAETVDVDFGSQTPHEAPAATAAPTGELQGQFLFLLVLTALGMVGIVGILRDFRRGHAH
ncbi:MAG: hypothetical protein U0514_04090 [Candidatus Andersenbacteria bacterium]